MFGGEMRIKFKFEKNKEFYVSNGNKYWLKRGVWHRLSGPAIEYTGGAKYWYEDGRFIRSEYP